MNFNPQLHPTLLAKAIAGLLTDEERTELDRWRAQSPRNEALYQQATQPGHIARQSRIYSAIDTEKALAAVTGQQPGRKNIRLRVAAAVAAVLVPLVSLVVFTHQPDTDPIPQTGLQAHAPARQNYRPAFTPVETPNGIAVTAENNAAPAKTENGVILAEKLEKIALNTLNIPRGSEFSLKLDDGTVVILNSETRLTYPVHFASHERRVKFSGEAYFQVAHDPNRPFIVEIGDSRIQVLGTSFNVSAYSDEAEIVTTLIEGCVQFDSGEHTTLLRPGEQAVFNGSNLSVQEVDTYIYTAWQDGLTAFSHERLEDIMRKISRWYDINVVWENDGMREVRFTGKIERYSKLEKVAEMFERTGVRIEVEGSTIYIR